MRLLGCLDLYIFALVHHLNELAPVAGIQTMLAEMGESMGEDSFWNDNEWLVIERKIALQSS